MIKNRVVLKFGGASLKESAVRNHVLQTIEQYRKYDYQVILVHGGGPAINEELTKQGISWEFIRGQRKTTPEMMSVIEDVLWRKVNVSLVQEMQDLGLKAQGLSGADDHILVCKSTDPELGLVGTMTSVNTNLIEKILSEGTHIPVIAPLGVDAMGHKYNINADWAASKLAAALNAEKLIFLTDQNGILNEAQELIPVATIEKLLALIKHGVVTGGMLTKVLTVVDALENGVSQVRVMNGSQANHGLWSDYIGTLCGDAQRCSN